MNIGHIGRNDPCPCGSGLKYKKCCLTRELDAELLYEKELDEWVKRDLEQGEKNLKEMLEEQKNQNNP